MRLYSTDPLQLPLGGIISCISGYHSLSAWRAIFLASRGPCSLGAMRFYETGMGGLVTALPKFRGHF